MALPRPAGHCTSSSSSNPPLLPYPLPQSGLLVTSVQRAGPPDGHEAGRRDGRAGCGRHVWQRCAGGGTVHGELSTFTVAAARRLGAQSPSRSPTMHPSHCGTCPASPRAGSVCGRRLGLFCALAVSRLRGELQRLALSPQPPSCPPSPCLPCTCPPAAPAASLTVCPPLLLSRQAQSNMVLVLFATTFALSCGMFELIIFEIADVLSRPFVQEAMPPTHKHARKWAPNIAPAPRPARGFSFGSCV